MNIWSFTPPFTRFFIVGVGGMDLYNWGEESKEVVLGGYGQGRGVSAGAVFVRSLE